MAMADEVLFEFLHMELVAYIHRSSHKYEKENCIAKLESLGYRVGQSLVERFTKDCSRFKDELDIMKFMCKDFWNAIYKKQVDNLRTNHQGVYVLLDNRFKFLTQLSNGKQYMESAPKYLAFPCGLIRGALSNLGINCIVTADVSAMPAYDKYMNKTTDSETHHSDDDNVDSVDNDATEATSDASNDVPAKTLQLRPYQEELATLAVAGKNVIIVAPTGSGKTIVAVKIMQEHLLKRGVGVRKILFLVNQVALAKQQYDACKEYMSDWPLELVSGDTQDTNKVPLKNLLDKMTVDAGKGFTLPSGPSNLCFDKEEFMKTEFHVDQFVVECRRHVQLESLRDDLNIYLKILKSAMIELINKDYADFVNLSTNLVGMDKAISSLTVPLGQLKEEVLNVRSAMDDAIAAVENKLKQQQEIQQKKACLQRLMNITKSVEKIEHLLGIKASPECLSNPQAPGQLSGQLIERVATEFNKLQFYVTKSRGLPLVEKIKPRIAMITTTLQYSLEGSFLEGLETSNVDVLRQCLRTYALIDKTKDAEMLFRQHVVKPYMEEVITEQFIRSNSQGLRGMFAKVLEFIPKKCKVLKDVTSGGSGTTEVVRGYDFLINSVWPDIVSNLEARTPSIFAPGNPDVFHGKYLLSMDFLARFERMCGSQASVKRLREHPSYQTFMSKWSLPVYFQIRFQEIAGAFEFSLTTGLNNAESSSDFKLHSTATLWEMLGRGWGSDVFLPSLAHRFWKLDLQLLSRYASWLDDIYDDENSRRKELAQDKPIKSVSVGVNGEQPRSFSPQPPETPPNPPITIGQIVCVICDSEKLTLMLPSLFDNTVLPQLLEAQVHEDVMLRDCLEESKVLIEERLPKFEQFLVGDIISQCSVYLKQVGDIPRLYRRTNREIPSKPSTYAVNLLKPVRVFVDDHSKTLGEKQRDHLLQQVFSSIAEQYHGVTSEVLTSVKKMEDSLKRLKKARGNEKSSGTHGMTDDDKIRQQLYVDISSFGKEVESFGLSLSVIHGFKDLENLAVEAKATMAS